MSESILIRNAEGMLTGLSGEAERATGDIRIRDGKIAMLGPNLTPETGEQVLDATGCVVYPGLISTHHHLFQSVLKGVRTGIDLPLEGWLRSVPYTYWHKLDREALEISATIGMAELLLSGTTTVADHHYLFAQSYDFEPAEVIFDVAEKLGLRMVLCRGGSTVTRSFDDEKTVPMPTETLDGMLKRIEGLAQRYNDTSPDAMRRIVVAPTTPPWSLKVEELKVVAQAARAMGLRLHSHLSETQHYVKYCREVYNQKPVHWVAEHDWLGEDVWFAHLVHMDPDEIAVLAETRTGMAHCPQSNCRLGSGIAPGPAFVAAGGRISLAVDGAASNEAADMINEMHCAWMVHRAAHGAGAVRAEEVVRWATAGGADVLALPALGSIEVGKTADLAIFDLHHPRYAGLHDPLVGPVVAGGAADLRHVLVGGRTVVKDGMIPGLDLRELSAKAANVVRRLAA